MIIKLIINILDEGQGFKEKDTIKYLIDFIVIDLINLDNILDLV